MDEMLDAAPCGFLRFTDDGTILAANATLHAWLGYAPASLAGRRFEALLSPSGRVFYQTYVFPLLKHHGEVEELYLALRDQQGNDMPVLLNAARRTHAGAQAYSCVLMPMRQRGRYEGELLQARRVAQAAMAAETSARTALVEERAQLAGHVAERTADLSAANAALARAARLKDEFLASMSHELRTPLSAILGFAEAMREQVYGALNERQDRALQRIEDTGRHLLALINDILDFAKIGAGKLELARELVSIDQVCQASLYVVSPAAQAKQITLQCRRDPDAKRVAADARRLKQILINLLSNAVKFTPEGGTVGLDVMLDEAAAALRFSVWDTGIGIAADQLAHVLEPFVQLDGRLARQYEGTGLGLALVTRMAELHGGSLTVASEVGVGSRFTVALPWCDEAPAAIEPAALYPAPAGRPTLLLAEDNEASLQLLTSSLDDAGYRVVVARNGAEAAERARDSGVALILMDLQMPGVDGLEATRHIRADAQTQAVPIIALTALELPGDRERCLAAGADEYLAKPIHLQTLLKTIGARLIRRPEHDHA